MEPSREPRNQLRGAATSNTLLCTLVAVAGAVGVDALQALPEIGVEAPIGYAGVALGVVTGLMLTAIESRIAMIDGTS
jgi:hypothetical protein